MIDQRSYTGLMGIGGAARSPQGDNAGLRILILCVLTGFVVIVVVEVFNVSRGLRDVGLVLGGAQIGFLSLLVEEKFLGLAGKARDTRDARLYQVTADSSFYLGFFASQLSLGAPTMDPIVQCCNNLGIQFAPDELERLHSPESNAEAQEASEMVLRKGQSLGPPLRCFLRLGNTVAWLNGQLDQLDGWYRTHAMLRQLEGLSEDPFLADDERYASVASSLIDKLTPYRERVKPSDRDTLAAEVRATLKRLPPFTPEEVEVRIAGADSGWCWVRDNGGVLAARIFGSTTILQRAPGFYEVSADGAPGIEVTRDARGWHCAAHPEAGEMTACPEIEVTLDATEAGQPVTEARLIPIRYGSAPGEADGDVAPDDSQ